MDWRAVCAAVIPCLNEEAAIGALVKEVRAHIPTVFVVDDGSTDATASVAQAAGARVIATAGERGKGAALRTGWTRAREAGFFWALTLDGDGQHACQDIPSFLRCAEQTGAALIVGNRMGQAAGMPGLRRWANRAMSRQLSKLSGQTLPDSQCGYRLINLDALSRVRLQAEHFEIESEVLLAFTRAKLQIRFVPVQVIYKTEQSKIHPWRDTVRWLTWRWKAQRGRRTG